MTVTMNKMPYLALFFYVKEFIIKLQVDQTEASAMKRIVLNILDDKKAETLLAVLQDLSYVDAETDDGLKKWPGNLSVFSNPIHIENFNIFSREELHER